MKDTIDAENAAHAAYAGVRTVPPMSRVGMIVTLRVLKVCRKTSVAARRLALQMFQTQVVSDPEELRDKLRNMSRI